MKIVGAYITKEVVVPEHVEHVLDEDAYWILDWEGQEDPEGTYLYAKGGFPRLRDAQQMHRTEAEARTAERGRRQPRPRRKAKAAS